jgi:hypothetical protein
MATAVKPRFFRNVRAANRKSLDKPESDSPNQFMIHHRASSTPRYKLPMVGRPRTKYATLPER